MDSAIAGATIADADTATKGKIQLAGDLAGTAAAPTVPGLALKENAENKSTTTTLGTSDVLFPTQKAVKTYVDTAIAGATIADADTATKGKIKLAGDLAGTADSPEVATGVISTAKLATNAVTTAKITNASVTNAKLDKANIPLSGFAAASAAVDLGSNKLTNVSNPTSAQDAATKNYVDTAIAGATIADADATTKGKIQLAGDLAGTAASPTVPGLALKEDAANKTVSVTTDGASDVKFPSAKAVKTYADAKVIDGITDAETTSAPSQNAVFDALALKANATDVTTSLGLKANATDVTTSLALKEDAANKTVSVATDGASDEKFPSAKAVKTYADAKVIDGITDAETSSAPSQNAVFDALALKANATDVTTSLGLKANTADVTTSLALKEDAANKTLSVTIDGASDVKFPSAKAVKNYVDTAVSGSTTSVPYTGALAAVNLGAYDLTVNGVKVGLGAGQDTSNTVLGNSALNNNTTGVSSVAVGFSALKSSTTANSNTAIGNGAMEATTSGGGNVAIGMNAMSKNTIGQQNTAIGQSALYNNTDASANTVIGNSAGASITTGGYNTIIGTDAAGGLITGSSNTIIGRNVYSGDVSNNIIIGNGQGQIKAQHDGTSWTLGTIGSGVWNGTEIAIAKGGTGATTAAAALTNLGAQSSANLSTNLTTDAASVTKYPAVKTIKDYVDSSVSSGAPDATASLSGKIQLAGDLTGSAASPAVATGAITEAKLADNAVTSAKIKDGEIVNADVSSTAAIAYSKLNLTSSIVVGDLADNAVEEAKIKNDAVTTAKILDGTIANADVSSTAAIAYSKLNLASSIVVGDLADNAVETAKIKDAAVTNGKLDKTNIPLSGFGAATADVALGAKKLTGVADPTLAQDAATKNYVDTATAGITTLANGKIYLGNASNEATEVTPTGDVIITNAGVTAIGTEKVVAGMLATDAVETAKIKNLNVTTGKLADDAVTTVKITDANVTAAKLATDAVETAKIKDAAVTYAKIQNVSASNKVLGRVSANAGVVEEIATTGSGDVVRATSPTLVTPVLGAATGTSLSVSGQLTSTVAIGTAPLVVTSTTPVANLSIGGNAATVTTNANLTGPITSVGNATTITDGAVTTAKILDGTIAVGDLADNAVETAKIKDAAVTYAKIQNISASNKVLGRVSANAGVVEEIATTGSGDVVRATSPTLVTPVLGAATGTSLSVSGQLTSTVAIGTAPLVVTSTTPVANLSIGGNAATVTTNADLSGDVTSSGNTTTIGANKVVTGMIADGTIIVGDLANNAVEEAKIKNDAVTSAKIKDGEIVNADLSASAAIADTKLATIATAGKVSNSATTATDANTASAIVARDANGNFTAGTITANLTGVASKATNLNGGSLGDIAYQSAANSSSFLSGNTSATKKFLTQTGTGSAAVAPAWGTVGTADISDLGANVATFLATPSSINLFNAMTNKTGTGSLVFNTSPTLFSPTLGVATATSVAFSGATSGTATIAAPATAGTTTITLPGASGTLATLAGTETLTNKTLTSPILTTPTLGVATATSVGYSGSTSGTATIVAPAIAGTTTITLPGATGTLATLAGAETLTNKTLTSPALGVATATSINKVNITTPSTGATLTIANGKTLTANNSIVLAGTDDKTMTFPTTDATIARTDAAQTFTGVQTFSSDIVVNSVNIGRGNGAIVTNTAVGTDAISATATGTENAALGYNALKAVTSGSRNAVVGSQAAKALLTGIDNIALGYRALSTATSSESNTAIGSDALKVLGDSTNDRNTAVGTGSFSNLTTGQYNVAVGQGTFLNATSGSNNVGVGKYAGFRDINDAGVTSSNKSVFIGAETKPLNATSTNEIVIGYDARGLGNNTTVLGNSLITQAKVFGALNLPDATTSTSATTGALTVAGGAGIAENLNVGGDAKITGTLTVTSGAGAGKVLTSDANGLGTWTTPAGVTTMAAIGSTPNANGATISGVNLNLEPASATYGGVVTTGAQTFAGAKTFSPTLTAAANGETLVGLDINPTFTNGSYTGLTNYGLRVQGIGFGRGGGGIETNTAVGTGVLINNFNGSNNTGLGNLSLVANTSGIENTGIGTNSLNRTSTGSNNTAIGSNSGDKLTTGAKNIFVGSLAGSKIASSTTSNTTGANSVLIGYDVRPAADGETNEIVISGYNGTAGTVGKGSNTTSIGNAATTDTYIYGNLIVSGQVKLNSTSSVLVLSKTANYNIATTDNANLIIFKGSTASQTIKLPAASANIGREITIKNIATVSVSIESAGGYLISDSSTTTAATLAIGIEPSNNWIKAISDGTDWIILRALF